MSGYDDHLDEWKDTQDELIDPEDFALTEDEEDFEDDDVD